MLIKKGDRVELLAMPQDPCPIEVGSQGTVDRVVDFPGPSGWTQVSVDWDSGRSLDLVIPPDDVRVIS